MNTRQAYIHRVNGNVIKFLYYDPETLSTYHILNFITVLIYIQKL